MASTSQASAAQSSSPPSPPLLQVHQQQQEPLPPIAELQIDESAAADFSQNIARVVNLAHLMPTLSVPCQKFQLEQAAAAVSFERGTTASGQQPSSGLVNNRDRLRAAHFVDGLKRGFDFCLTAAKAALSQAQTSAASAASSQDARSSNSRGQSPNSCCSSSVDTNNNNNNNNGNNTTTNTTTSTDSVAASSSNSTVNNNNNNHPQQQLIIGDDLYQGTGSYDTRASSMPQLTSYNSCDEMFACDDNVMQCVAELSYYTVQVLQQCFVIARHPVVRRQMQELACERRMFDYIRGALGVSRDVECTWFAEGFRTMHMNLLCNGVFEAPAACRASLACDGLLPIVLFCQQHLDPENPGLNEWSAFTLRNLTQAVPEAAEAISEMKRRAPPRSPSPSP